MEVYERILRRVQGAMWAHHRRLMPERQFQRILGYVYSHKYEYQIRFDEMACVGTELNGHVEVTITPAGFVKRVRVDPSFEDYPSHTQRMVLLSAYSKARQEGRDLMAQAELRIYKQFLTDLKPVVLGIRDNPEFYTIQTTPTLDGATPDIETPKGTLQGSTAPLPHAPHPSSPPSPLRHVHRTIPYTRAHTRQQEWAYRQTEFARFIHSPAGRVWSRTPTGKATLYHHYPEYGRGSQPYRPPGSPGAPAPSSIPPLDLPVPYMAMEETALLKRNWVAYLENVGVAQRVWTRVQGADRLAREREMQASGEAWHSAIQPDAVKRY